jgi:hypothetical protein
LQFGSQVRENLRAFDCYFAPNQPGPKTWLASLRIFAAQPKIRTEVRLCLSMLAFSTLFSCQGAVAPHLMKNPGGSIMISHCPGKIKTRCARNKAPHRIGGAEGISPCRVGQS